MKINSNVVLIGSKVILVPYRVEHVPRYHTWMQDSYILEMTASEPLSLQEEYENQKSWETDEQKLTFIILDKSLPDTDGVPRLGGQMAGDVNFFFQDADDAGCGEINVMIAEESSRRKGLAQEAIHLIMRFALVKLAATSFIARISDKNQPSLLLFQRLGFQTDSHSDYFAETTLRKAVSPEFRDLLTALPCLEGSYDKPPQ